MGSEEEKTCRISDKDEKLVREVSPSQWFLQSAISDASLLFLYHGAKKVKNDQKLKSRGLALNEIF